VNLRGSWKRWWWGAKKEIAGKPISLLLTEQMATVTLCHIRDEKI
jgi:5,10-methylene-tetrahydrofolate dehydrogenase/methenyl tetrahydrofolate cyclohydrolase